MRSSWTAIANAQKYGMALPKPKNSRKAKKRAAKKKLMTAARIAANAKRQVMKERAQKMRDNPTPAERALWKLLSQSSLTGGFKFTCQQEKLGNCILDFACQSVRLCVEVDGGYHADPEQVRKDSVRTWRLRKIRWRVIRFTNSEVLADTAGIVAKIVAVCRERKGKR